MIAIIDRTRVILPAPGPMVPSKLLDLAVTVLKVCGFTPDCPAEEAACSGEKGFGVSYIGEPDLPPGFAGTDDGFIVLLENPEDMMPFTYFAVLASQWHDMINAAEA